MTTATASPVLQHHAIDLLALMMSGKGALRGKTNARNRVPLLRNPYRSGKLTLGESCPRTDQLVTSTGLQRHEGGARTFCGVIVSDVRPPSHASSSLDQVTADSPRS
ncbi:hypothetical protein [Nocardia rhamnosiphila]